MFWILLIGSFHGRKSLAQDALGQLQLCDELGLTTIKLFFCLKHFGIFYMKTLSQSG